MNCFIVIKKQTAIAFLLVCSVLLLASPLVVLWTGRPVNTFTDPQNKMIIIDPGHGGIDGGTSKEGVLEKEINLGIGIKLKKVLEERGYRVVMTREEDVALGNGNSPGTSRHAEDLKKRVEIINGNDAQIFVSLHVNCNIKKPKTDGSIVFYSNKFDQSKQLALSIQRSLNSIITKDKNRTIHDPKEAAFYLLKNSAIPGVLIETAFLSNTAERRLLQEESFREALAKSIADGIENYFALIQ